MASGGEIAGQHHIALARVAFYAGGVDEAILIEPFCVTIYNDLIEHGYLHLPEIKAIAVPDLDEDGGAPG